MKIYDGHVHSPFCPHGTTDQFEEYITRAIELGYSGMTFAEHAPLPRGFVDPTPTKDSAMDISVLYHYIDRLQKLKKIYQNEIEIKIGLEVDFIEGYEKETADLLNNVGPILDDSILSVHFLHLNNHYHCIDYSLEGYENALGECDGSLNALYECYVKTLILSITSDLGRYKPNRLGHITLPAKFQTIYPIPALYKTHVTSLLELVRNHSFALDYNGAGVNKPYCGDTYPPMQIANQAFDMGIPLIYGSDAHQALSLGQGLPLLSQHVQLSSPI